jgi:ribosome biogenesis protein ERB1
MALEDIKITRQKRKQAIDTTDDTGPFSQEVGLEMSSDEEGENVDSESDDGEVDEFPDIDTRSDSEDEDESSGEDEDEEDDENSGVESDLHTFPKAKNIISDITGKPKRVYPEIEPNYDSDSSTEDVRKYSSSFRVILKTSWLRLQIASVTCPCTGTTTYRM